MIRFDLVAICLQTVDFSLIISGGIDLADHARACYLASLVSNKIDSRLVLGRNERFVSRDDQRTIIIIAKRAFLYDGSCRWFNQNIFQLPCAENNARKQEKNDQKPSDDRCSFLLSFLLL